MTNRTLSLAAFATALLMLSGAAEASLVRSFSLQELFKEADVVLVGKVVESVSFWNEAHDTIYTEHTVSVERAEKGSANDKVTVRLMGGTVDGKTLSVAGNARMEKGERVLLVLRKAGPFHVVVGMSQGKWSVRQVDGVDHVWRGERIEKQSRQPGERSLDGLLEVMRSSCDATEGAK